jgi:cytochrome c peroxidase
MSMLQDLMKIMAVRPLAFYFVAFLYATAAIDTCNAQTGSAKADFDWRDVYRRPLSVPYPTDNPYSVEKAKLGKVLFFDPILSGGRNRACVSCHLPELAWGDGLAKAVGDRHLSMDLRSPTLLNVAWIPRLGWIGRFADIEAVTFSAISGITNMDLSAEEALKRISASPSYSRRFDNVFGPGPITQEKIEQALATFERGIVSSPAPFDLWISGDDTALSAAAKRGFALFDGKAGCSSCHEGWSFTDYSFHDIGTAVGDDIGRALLFPSSVALHYAFKVPTLRDVTLRAPYMHNGSLPTLAAVVELYDRGGIERPSRSLKIKPLGLTDLEKADIIEFLSALTSKGQLTDPPLQPR